MNNKIQISLYDATHTKDLMTMRTNLSALLHLPCPTTRRGRIKQPEIAPRGAYVMYTLRFAYRREFFFLFHINGFRGGVKKSHYLKDHLFGVVHSADLPRSPPRFFCASGGSGAAGAVLP